MSSASDVLAVADAKGSIAGLLFLMPMNIFPVTVYSALAVSTDCRALKALKALGAAGAAGRGGRRGRRWCYRPGGVIVLSGTGRHQHRGCH